MNKNGIPWNTLLTVGAVAVGGYFIYTLILKPLLNLNVPVLDAVSAAVTQPQEMAAAVSGALGGKGLINTTEEAQKVAETLAVTLPEITPTNLMTNPLRTVIKGVEVIPEILSVLTLPPQTKKDLAVNTVSASIVPTNKTPSNVTKMASQYQLDIINKFIKDTGVLGW
jgi:hypothetical protein